MNILNTCRCHYTVHRTPPLRERSLLLSHKPANSDEDSHPQPCNSSPRGFPWVPSEGVLFLFCKTCISPLFTFFITPALLLQPFSLNSEFLKAEDNLFYLLLLCHRKQARGGRDTVTTLRELIQTGYIAVKSYWRCSTILFNKAQCGPLCISREQKRRFKDKQITENQRAQKYNTTHRQHQLQHGLGTDGHTLCARVHSHPAPL